MITPTQVYRAIASLCPGSVAPGRDYTLDKNNDIATWTARHCEQPSKSDIAKALASPATEVPKHISPTQLRLQLVNDGKSLAQVAAVIASLPEPTKTAASILWEYSLEFRRAHPLVIQLAGALGYDTPAKLDSFFIAAAHR